jgi:hypothetical protein
MPAFMPEPVADATLGRSPRTFAQWATQNTAVFS